MAGICNSYFPNWWKKNPKRIKEPNIFKKIGSNSHRPYAVKGGSTYHDQAFNLRSRRRYYSLACRISIIGH